MRSLRSNFQGSCPSFAAANDASTTPADRSRSTRPRHADQRAATPRLITVVEMAKRAFAVLVLTRKATAHSIYQYNETGLLESEAEVPDLARVLAGKTRWVVSSWGLQRLEQSSLPPRPKMTHRPFLRITLNTQPLEACPPTRRYRSRPPPAIRAQAQGRAPRPRAGGQGLPPLPIPRAPRCPSLLRLRLRRRRRRRRCPHHCEAPPHVGVTPQLEPKKKRKSNANDEGGSKRRRQ
jgi:hypothetical protein